MALVLKKPPVMLKDYLFCRDDLSSCSSNGFRSFPRRQCCTTIRFPLQKQTSSSNGVMRPPLKPPRSKSALHKASQVLLNAVKLLPFPSVKPQARKGSSGLLLLPRSLSKKLAKMGLVWRRKDRDQCNENCQIERWRSSHDQQKVDEPVADHETADCPKTTSTAISSGRGSTSTSSSDSKISNRNSRSEFTSTDNLPSPSSSNSEVSEIKNDFVQQELQVSDGVGVPVGDGDEESKEASSSDEGKEQFSPVSVLDCCPFDEDESDDSSPFQLHHLNNGATNHKLIQKLRRIDGLQPLDLEKRLAPLLSHSAEEEQEEENEIFRETCSVSESDTSERLQFYFRSSLKLRGSDSDKLLLDFMSERSDHETDERDLFSEAEDWIRGQPKNLIFGWEVRRGRELYLKEMDKDGSWANLGLQRKQIEAQLEKDVLSILMDELVADIFQL